MDDLAHELEASQKECRNYNSELFRLRAAWDETIEQLDVVKRENKNLADEIKDLLDQLGDGGRSIHELDKQRRRLEVEKEELQNALEEAEAALEQEENRVVRAQLELGQVRQEIDRKIQEKEEEFDNTRYPCNYQLYTGLSLTLFCVLGKTTKEQWTQCRLHLKLKEELKQKHCGSKRSLNLTSMNWKLLWTTATKQMQRLTNLSKGTKINSEMLNKPMKKKAGKDRSWLKKLVWQTEEPMP